ncbi:N-acetyltransferase [Thermococcus sp. 2319x1]|uniref:GNAT family N-acetyltransferase n=1 Tax=Thermococcus sp. 2319x1 TaxID=1674923 RepID=UPI001583BD80|nr:GNAT family N-acetyltransferase [Thermococcus sp. 2319x1]
MEYKIVDGESYLEEIKKLDREISYSFVRSSISYEEFAERHEELFRDLLSHGEHKFFAALDEKGNLLGHVWVCLTLDTVDYVKTAYIYDIEVVKKARGLGIGSALLRKAEAWAREKGAKKVVLRVEVDNPAVKWYEERGYQARALIMEKLLDDDFII